MCVCGGRAQATYDQTFLRFIIFLKSEGPEEKPPSFPRYRELITAPLACMARSDSYPVAIYVFSGWEKIGG